MTEAAAAPSFVAFALSASGFTWQAVRSARDPVSSPDRLVGELRLAQMAALLLALTAGAYIGFAVAHEAQPGVGFDIALAVGFFVVAAATLVRDPRQALTILALAFAAHAILDVAHRPGWPLPDGVAPRWYSVGCAVYDVVHRRALLSADAEALIMSLRIRMFSVIVADSDVDRASNRVARGCAAAADWREPKLIVILVADQMRADYLDRYSTRFTGGLRRLMQEGAWFRNAAYPYLNTITCAGHSTIGTGTFPYQHGMFLNTWFDRKTRQDDRVHR